MSDAYEALANLTYDDIAAYGVSSEEEKHIIIGLDRRIVVPDALKRIAVQYDHNIETVTFDCPRYWDDHDMSKMIVYINYRLPNGDLGSYIATNIKASGDRMTFDWTILKGVTQYKGGIAFLICIKKTDSEGLESNHWNSELCTDMYISEGLETVEQETYSYPDLVNQLLERMTVVEQINVQAEEMQVLYDNTVAAAAEAETARSEVVSAKESVDAAEAYIRDSYANAVRNVVSGAYVKTNDVSPIEHTVKTKVRSKNLIPYPYDDIDRDVNGVVFTTLVDGGIHVSGTPITNSSFNLTMQYKKRLMVEKNKTYTVSVESSLTSARGYVFIQNWANGEVVDNHSLRNGTMTFTASVSGSLQIGIVLIKDQVFDEVMHVWLEEGTVATPFTPYVNPSSVTVYACGKNLLKNIGKTQTLNGVTCTINEDGSVTVNGTASKATFFHIGKFYPVLGERHRLSGCPSGGSFNTYLLYIHNNTTGVDVYDVGSGKTFTGSAGDQSVNIAVYEGATVENLKFYPMIVVGEGVEMYESYIGSSYTTSSDGTVAGVTSVMPTMYVYPSAVNVNLEVEYNRDLNKYLETLRSLVEAGGSTISTTFTDTVTGIFYGLSVVDGKLTLTNLGV